MDIRLRKLLASGKDIPEEWQPKYLLDVIGFENPIEITWRQRDAIIEAINGDVKYVNIKDEYTVMINSIRSIKPYWGERNIPPYPSPSVWQSSAGVKETTEGKKWLEIFGELQYRDTVTGELPAGYKTPRTFDEYVRGKTKKLTATTSKVEERYDNPLDVFK